MDAIRRHLAQFPDASDTPRGVQEWWLPQPLCDHPLDAVTRTLWRMVADGELVASRLVNGTILFARPRDAPPRDTR